MRLQGNKIKLRPIADSDTDNIIKWRNKDFVRANFFYQDLFSRETHEKWLRTKVDTGLVDQFIITRIDTNQDIGSVYIRDIDTLEGTGEYGIFIGEEDAVGLGFGTEAAQMMIEYAAEELRLNVLRLRLRKGNTQAFRSYLAAGFTPCDSEQDEVVFMERKL